MATTPVNLPTPVPMVDQRNGLRVTPEWQLALQGLQNQASAAGDVVAGSTLNAGQLIIGGGGKTITVGNLSGDVTTSGGTTTTLAASGVTPGTYGDATHVPQVTVDSKGRVTAATNIAITDTGITQLTGDVTAGPGSGSQVATLAASGVVPGTYTNATVTVDAKGRVTSASSGVAGGSWIPTVDGSEPPVFITDGAGVLILVAA